MIHETGNASPNAQARGPAGDLLEIGEIILNLTIPESEETDWVEPPIDAVHWIVVAQMFQLGNSDGNIRYVRFEQGQIGIESGIEEKIKPHFGECLPIAPFDERTKILRPEYDGVDLVGRCRYD